MLFLRSLLFLSLIFISSCDKSGSLRVFCLDCSSELGSGDTLLALTVESLYPLNGEKWNDYVSSSSAGDFNQTDTACNAATDTYCTNGGLRKIVTVTGKASCDNLTIEEDLGLFNWKCDLRSGVATFFLQGFVESKRLSDTLTVAGFKDNFVTVKESGITIGSSSAANWWPTTDVVVLDPTSPAGTQGVTVDGGTGTILFSGADAENTIYVVNKNSTSNGFIFESDKTSLIIMPGFSYGLTAFSVNNCEYGTPTGELAGADTKCVLSAGDQDFLWIEGNFDGNTVAQKAISLVGVNFSELRGVNAWNVSDAASFNIILTNSHQNRLSYVNSSYAEGFSDRQGIYLNNSNGNRFYKVTAANSEGIGIEQSASHGNVFQRVLSMGSKLHILSSSGNLYSGISSVNGTAEGIQLISGSSYNILQNILVANNNDGISYSFGANFNTFAHLVAAHNTSEGLAWVNASPSQNNFRGTILVGNNGTNCNNLGAGNELVNPCDDPTDFTGRDAAVFGRDLTAAFKGKVSFGLSPVNQYFDAEKFEFGIGLNGSAFPNADHRGQCDAGCVLWDFSLADSDFEILNTVEDGFNQNAAFVDGQACPALLDGDNIFTASTQTESPGIDGDDDGYCESGETCLVSNQNFHKYAFEFLFDGEGDDDGLCEDNEYCYFSPNFGAYQGHGDPRSIECTFTDGAAGTDLQGVRMFAFPTNGYP